MEVNPPHQHVTSDHGASEENLRTEEVTRWQFFLWDATRRGGGKLWNVNIIFLIVAIPLCYFTFSSLAVSLRTTRFDNQKILHVAGFALGVLCGSENRERLVTLTALTGWFL